MINFAQHGQMRPSARVVLRSIPLTSLCHRLLGREDWAVWFTGVRTT